MAPIPVPLSPARLAASGLRIHASESAFREGSATIVLPTASAAFLNPVQEFNRDLSVLAIRAWGDMMNDEMRAKWEKKREKKKDRKIAESGSAKPETLKRGAEDAAEGAAKKMKDENGASTIQVVGAEASNAGTIDVTQQAGPSSTPAAAPAKHEPKYPTFRFTILEALSATGLRSIRYAREIPNVKYVVANDLSASAVKAMKRNVALNFPASRPIETWVPEAEAEEKEQKKKEKGQENGKAGDESNEDEPMPVETGEAATGVASAEQVHTANGTSTHPEATAETATETSPSAEEHAAETASGPSKNSGSSVDKEAADAEAAIHPDCRIRINEGDALDMMYTHRKPSSRYHVVDLDPYGSAAPFLDAAVQSVADGGLLCVTCTDMGVLASTNYTEKAYAQYGGCTTRVEYCHEIALRLVLHAIASAAAKYGRHIEPLLSLSIDFYVRLFIRVDTGPIEVKNLASKTGIAYTCSYCQNFTEQRFGKSSALAVVKGAQTMKYGPASGPPPVSPSGRCDECGSTMHVAGPMWLDPIHSPTFCDRLLSLLSSSPLRSRTASRIRGMVSTAASELPSSPFYFTPAKIAGMFHCLSPSLPQTISALLSAGHSVSRSHCLAGSIKTCAPRKQVYDLMRSWIHPHHPVVKLDSLSPTSPAKTLNDKPKVKDWEWTTQHPDVAEVIKKEQGGGVRYQANPTKDWGPGKAARKR